MKKGCPESKKKAIKSMSGMMDDMLYEKHDGDKKKDEKNKKKELQKGASLIKTGK